MKSFLLLTCTVLVSYLNGQYEILSAESIAGEDLVFSYQAKHLNDYSDSLIKLNCALKNTSQDTLSFLTSTCNGIRYSLRFNEADFELHEMIRCRSSERCVKQLAPNQTLNFTAYLKAHLVTDSLKLGIDLFQIDGGISNSDSMNLEELSHFRAPQEIIWGKTVQIERE